MPNFSSIFIVEQKTYCSQVGSEEVHSNGYKCASSTDFFIAFSLNSARELICESVKLTTREFGGFYSYAMLAWNLPRLSPLSHRVSVGPATVKIVDVDRDL